VESPLVFRDVSYRLPDGRWLLEDLDLELGVGQTLVLLGRSGCGKTTTMKLINRLLEPTRGRVEVEGRPTLEWDVIALRRRIGYVLQDAGLFPHWTVRENVGLVPELLGWDPERIRARVDELLEMLGLDPVEHAGRYPDALSGGQRQRVGIARALAADPAILLLDEPFSALDPITRRALQAEFRALVHRLGKTMVLVTHDIREARALAHQVVLLHEGRAVFQGTPGHLESSDHPEVRAFLACLEDEGSVEDLT
jgi:osmoprotectant transport system ATP-binding protein